MSKRTKNKKWFKKVRGSYLPNSREAWLSYIPYTAFLILVPVIFWGYTTSVAKTVWLSLPFWAIAVSVMTWVAQRKS